APAGGTGLYVRAVIDGLAVPERDLDVRAAWIDATATAEGLSRAYGRLAELDPVAASRVEPGNRRRIVRALEVIETTGRRFSSFGPGLDTYGKPVIDVTQAGVWLPRAELQRRIEHRFGAMRDAGLVREVDALATRPGGMSRTAAQAIGYRELLDFRAGHIASLDAAFAEAVARTRRFARRQRVWFRRDPRIRWIGTSGNPQRLAAVVVALWDVPATAPAPAS
ncbi:MAG TPA: tRNA dimethylallyltransferase, partial [Acidimicrobiia bacterium]|nr:tRNA dimethylallyltransferase [Acidimicrobiia bacterium]